MSAPHASAPLTDIAQIAANLPGVLGYYPRESALAVVLSHQEAGRYGLRPRQGV